jgi:hypothetical protein
VTTSFDQASADLASQVAAVISQADGYMATGDVKSAIAAYQSAGNAGASVVGPEIDAVGFPNDTQPLTHQAWVVNGQLASINPGSTSQQDGLKAQSLADTVLTLLNSAIDAGKAAQAQAASGWSLGKTAAVLAGVSIVGGVLTYMIANRKKAYQHSTRMRPKRISMSYRKVPSQRRVSARRQLAM